MNRYLAISIIAVFGIISLVLALIFTLGFGSAYPQIDNISCVSQAFANLTPNSTSPNATYAHAGLQIYKAGQNLTIPAGIGIINGANGTCRYQLYTNDTTGTIRFASSAGHTFTLGEFLDVWNYSARISNNTIARLPEIQNGSTATINGIVYPGNYSNIVLAKNEYIVIAST